MTLQTRTRGPDAHADALVVWLHGLGASADDFVPVVPMLGLPRVRFVFPQAPDIEVTVNAGYVMPAWYDIRHLEPGPHREDVDGLRELVPELWSLVAEEQAQVGVGPERTILAGFSQGGATALFMADRAPAPLAGLMVLSAYELAAERTDAEATPGRAATPSLHCHGQQDAVVPMSRGRAAYQAARAAGRDCAWHDFAMGHEVVPAELLVIRRWLHGLVGPEANG